MNQKIETTIGDLRAEYVLVYLGNCNIAVDVPFVDAKTGALGCQQYCVRPADIPDVLEFFRYGVLVLPANNAQERLTLIEVLEGKRYPSVHVITS